MPSPFTEFIKTHSIFTSVELLDACGHCQNTRNLLHNACATGRVRKVRRGLYVSNAGRFEGSVPPFQLVAAKAAADSTLCYSTAFSLFLGSQDVQTEVSFYTAVQMKPFRFDNMRYVPYPMPTSLLESKAYRLANGSQVMGTTKEQTIVDSLAHVGRAGGVEAVLRRLSAVRFLDVAKAIDQASERGPSICARLGWVFERKARDWGVTTDELYALSHRLSGGPYYLGPAAAKVYFDERWRLYLPEEAWTLEEWING